MVLNFICQYLRVYKWGKPSDPMSTNRVGHRRLDQEVLGPIFPSAALSSVVSFHVYTCRDLVCTFSIGTRMYPQLVHVAAVSAG